MLRFLILEDDPKLLPQVRLILETEFPGADVSTATTSHDALALLKSSLTTNEPFDAAIIDCRIPANRGSSAEIEYTVGEAFRDSAPETTLIHFTAYVDEVSIRSELIKKHLRFENTRMFLQKQALWPEEMVLALHKAIETRLDRELEAVGRGHVVSVHSSATGRGRWNPSGDVITTGNFSAICARIEDLWLGLTPEFRDKVRKSLGAEEVSGRVHVGIAPDTTGAEDVTRELPLPANSPHGTREP